MDTISMFENFSDLELMKGLWYGEASLIEDSMMEEIREYLAIGGVVMNRLKLGKWGKTVKSVILAPKQFSCFNEFNPDGSINKLRDRIYEYLVHRANRDERLDLYATSVLNGRCRDFSEGATHYVARWLYETPKTKKHVWIPKMKITAVWGGHIFLREELGLRIVKEGQ